MYMYIEATGGTHRYMYIYIYTYTYTYAYTPPVAHITPHCPQQGEGSTYELVEVRVGGGLSRHDLSIQQGGPDTITRLRHFLLAGAGQLQDLHSKLGLHHPRGEADQLHKCIASAASGRGVFDGNVKVCVCVRIAAAASAPGVQGFADAVCVCNPIYPPRSLWNRLCLPCHTPNTCCR